MLNLVKIQEDLKGLPTQAILGYANGQNPQIPPYIALAELNRRKQLEQSVQAGQQPQEQGTIKDQIEQRIGLQSLQAQRQKQAMQAIAQRAMNSPTANPDGGGLAALPAGNAAPQAQAFKGGGIVSFVGGGNPEQEVIDKMTEDELSAYRRSKVRELLGAGKMLPPSMRSGRFPSEVVGDAALRQGDMEGPPIAAVTGELGIASMPQQDKTQATAQSQQVQAPVAPPQAQPRPPVQRQAAPTVKPSSAAQAGIASVQGQTDTFGTQIPQAPTMKEGFTESMGITDPYMKQEQAARQEYYDLINRQQAEREKNNAWDAGIAFMSGAGSGGTGRWQDAVRGSVNAYQAAIADQRRIKEEAELQAAKEKMGIAGIPAGYAKSALKEGADFKTKVYGEQLKGAKILSDAASTKYSVDKHLEGVLAHVRAQNAATSDAKEARNLNDAASNYTRLLDLARREIADETKGMPNIDQRNIDSQVITRAQQALPPHQKQLLFPEGFPQTTPTAKPGKILSVRPS